MSSENKVVSPAPQQPAVPQEQVKLVDAVISDQNAALNVIVGFVGVAQMLFFHQYTK